jgi:Peptidase family M48
MLGLALLSLTGGKAIAMGASQSRGHDPADVQRLVDDMKARLSIPERVAVTITTANPLMVSVEPIQHDPRAFELSFDVGFLDQLSEEELAAVIAHELGHVWIYTHHPYLQTESLANRIAMRLVTRESLEKVYEKVWKNGGAKGDIARFMQ